MNLNIKKSFTLNNKIYHYYSLKEFEKRTNFKIQKLPFSIRILLENLLRNQTDNINQIKDLIKNSNSSEIFFKPTRILMQDFTGIPAIVDLAAMRDKVFKMGQNIKKVNPLVPVDLVIDHSINVNFYGNNDAFNRNVKREFKENSERYDFLKWSQSSFKNFNVIPPGNGICHQVNLEYLAQVVSKKKLDNETLVYPDTLVGTDSHTTMINSLGVLGWGVGGIEAEAAMLNQPMPINVPSVVGVNLKKKLKEGVTATDLVLNLTNLLRKKNVVGKFVEFYGEGLKNLSLPDRATISNMAPEYGATCGFFPTDDITINYLKLTGRQNEQINLVKKYLKIQNLFNHQINEKIKFDKKIVFELDKIEPSVAGPKRPQDLVKLSEISKNFKKNYNLKVVKDNLDIENGSIAIAAITSCTNTSNPTLMIASGLLAKKAFELGLKTKPWVKTSLAPGSKVVTDYLKKANLQKYLDYLGFNLVGYGCTTCIGNSGPLNREIEEKIIKKNLTVCSILSGNRNFEGRINSAVKANYLASPPLVVAFAIFGNININFYNEPLGISKKNKKIFLKDIWPKQQEINSVLNKILSPKIFKKRYSKIFKGEKDWNKKSKFGKSDLYNWSQKSTYIKKPPFFEKKNNKEKIGNIINSKVLALLGDSITTDHISPAGRIKLNSLTSRYLKKNKVKTFDFNTYGARRGNHEVMMRGIFSNMEIPSVFKLSRKYKKIKAPSIIIAGKEYGTGSSRDWAAKGVSLLGVKAVIFETIERIHRTNLIGMGVLPLQFIGKDNAKTLKITGFERFDFMDLDNDLKPNKLIKCSITYKNKEKKIIKLKLRIDSKKELEYLINGGILPYVLKQICNEENTQNYENL